MPKRPTIGDVVEIPTERGLAYAQFTHEHPTDGPLLRVFPGLYLNRPKDLRELVTRVPVLVVFFPLRAAVSRQIVTIVSHERVPPISADFPTFRMAGGRDPQTKEVLDWWLWDGNKEWRVGRLTSEQEKLAVRAVVNDTMLKNRILQLNGLSGVGSTAPPREENQQMRTVSHYLYFQGRDPAECAERSLKHHNYQVELRRSGDLEKWLVIAREHLPSGTPSVAPTPGVYPREMAERLGGEYDGFEIGGIDSIVPHTNESTT